MATATELCGVTEPERRWAEALTDLTATRTEAARWREDRYRFAHKLGELLTMAPDGPVTGPAIYGVYMPWGPLYIGQTLRSERRLRDLPIGESHHLANTFPPEVWNRVIVLRWMHLPGAENAVEQHGQAAVSLALEHNLLSEFEPMVNVRQRTRGGAWRTVDLGRSASVGARTWSLIPELATRVAGVWRLVDAGDRSDGPVHVVEIALMDAG